MIIQTFHNEIRKSLIILWDYKFELLTNVFAVFIIIPVIMFFIGQGEVTETQAQTTFVGIILTLYTRKIIEDMGWILMSEAQAGTLEQMFMSPAPPQIVILGRLFASLIAGTVEMLMLLIPLLLLFRVSIPFPLAGVPIMLMSFIGLFGLGYIVAGMALVFKRIGPFSEILLQFMFLGNGTFLPISYFPTWIAALSAFFPGTIGIILLRRVTLYDYSFSTLLSDGSFALLTIHSVAFFIVGWVVFAICNIVARSQGTLGQY